MKTRTTWLLAGLTALFAFMEVSGLPAALFFHIQILDITPIYLNLMVNFLLIGMIAWIFLHFFCPDFTLGLQTEGFLPGLQKYGYVGLLITAVSFIGFYVGLYPFDRHPSFYKVLTEGVVFHIGVAIVEELYVRGLLLNFFKRLLQKRADAAFLAVVLSSLLFGLGHIPGVWGLPFYVIACKVTWTVSMGFFFGMLYQKSGSLWLPILFHFLINLSALPCCFSGLQGYAPLTLVIAVPAFVLLGIYSLAQLER